MARAGKDRAQMSGASTPPLPSSLGSTSCPRPSIPPAFLSLSAHPKPSATKSRVLAQKPCPRHGLHLDAAAPTASPRGCGCSGVGMDTQEWACKSHGLCSASISSWKPRGQTPKAGIPGQPHPGGLSQHIPRIFGSCGLGPAPQHQTPLKRSAEVSGPSSQHLPESWGTAG